MKIGDLHELTGIARNTIRYYEQQGLMSAADRTASGYRHYHEGHLEELRFLQRCRHLQLPQAQVMQLAQARRSTHSGTHHELADLLQQHLAQIEQQIAVLQHLGKDIEAILSQCDGQHDDGACGLIEAVNHACLD